MHTKMLNVSARQQGLEKYWLTRVTGSGDRSGLVLTGAEGGVLPFPELLPISPGLLTCEGSTEHRWKGALRDTVLSIRHLELRAVERMSSQHVVAESAPSQNLSPVF